MRRLSRYPRFETDDLDEACEYLERLLRRRIDASGHQGFSINIHTAKLEKLAIAAVETTGMTGENGLRFHSVSGDYCVTRVDSGALDSRRDSDQLIVGPGEGLYTIPAREAVLTRPSGDTTSVTVTIPTMLLQYEASLLIGDQVSKYLEIAGPVDLRPSSRLGQKLNFLLHQLELANGLFSSPEYTLEADTAQREFVQALIRYTDNSFTPLIGRQHGGSARRHIAKLEEYIEAHLRDALTIGDLAKAIGVNARTLRNDCRRMLDLTPEMVLRNRRMYAAHKRLQNPRPEDTAVAPIAHEFHFGHPGRFSHQYKEEYYGETPAETLQQGRRRLKLSLTDALGKPPEDQ